MTAPLHQPFCLVPQPVAAPAGSRLTFIVFSGEMDRLQAAFTLATGAAACGIDVTMFFTFWGVTLLKTGTSNAKKSLVERLLGRLLPPGPDGAPLSRLHMGGLGRALMTRQMRSKGIPALRELVAIAKESGIHFGICESTMQMMGIDRSELMADIDFDLCGVAHVWDQSNGGQVVFI